jgi:hypothetical protein
MNAGMQVTAKKAKPHIERRRAGFIRARGRMLEGLPGGRWIGFRKIGTRMRSGTFENRRQVGSWTTLDRGAGRGT